MEKKSAFVQEIYTDCIINAPAGKVYSILSDFGHYSQWTDEITITGDARPGGKMYVRVKTADNGNGWFQLSSKMKASDERIIAFDNVLWASFFFLGKHRFEIIPLSENQTRFVNAEVFSGLAVPFIRWKNLKTVTRRFKEHVNRALKAMAETPQTPPEENFI